MLAAVPVTVSTKLALIRNDVFASKPIRSAGSIEVDVTVKVIASVPPVSNDVSALTAAAGISAVMSPDVPVFMVFT